jgi:hypothetical protein
VVVTSRSFRSVIVAGMHRCGTSLMAGLLRQGGVDMGARLLGGGRGNPRGHFEDLEILEFHQRVFKVRGVTPLTVPPGPSMAFTAEERAEASALVARRSRSPLWGFKDPRVTALLDQWHELLPDPFYVLLYRHPIGVALSLVRRGTDREILADPAIGLDSWITACGSVLAFRRAHPERCVLWNIEGLSRDLEVHVRELDRRLGLVPRMSGIGAQFHPDEIDLEADYGEWRAAAPDAAALFDELEAEADVPGLQVPARRTRRGDVDPLLARLAERPRAGDTSPSPGEWRARVAARALGAELLGLEELAHGSVEGRLLRGAALARGLVARLRRGAARRAQ